MNSGVRLPGSKSRPCHVVVNLSLSQFPYLYNVANNSAYHTRFWQWSEYSFWSADYRGQHVGSTVDVLGFSPPAFLRYNWSKIVRYLKFTSWWFAICILIRGFCGCVLIHKCRAATITASFSQTPINVIINSV